MTHPILSIIIPVLDECANIPHVHARVLAALADLAYEPEFIFIDDGSTDGTLAAIEALNKVDPRVKSVSFSRNFGHQIALTAGMDYARGAAAIMLDGDLQHPPELIHELIRHWEAGYEIVYTVRESTRDAGWFKRASASVFYGLFRRLTGIDLPPNTADFRLLDRKVLLAFRGVRERTRFLRGLTYWVGFRSLGVPYRAGARERGNSKYGLRRMLAFAVDGILSFSTIPLYIGIYLGLGLACAGLLYMVFILYAFFFTNQIVQGWTSMILMALLYGGLQLVLLGIIGLYLGKVYEEVKNRPLYLVRREIGLD